MTIYIATDGEYSDYHIVAVFTDKKQAELFCATHNYMFEEYEADETKIETGKEPKKVWKCHITPSGNVTSCYECYLTLEDFIRKGSFGEWYATTNVGVSEEKARKIIKDKYAQLKAEQQNI